MSQYTDNLNKGILDKFSGFLKYLGVSESNLNKKPDQKYIFSFEDAEINKLWVAFFTAYTFGHRNGRIFEANHQASVIINSIKDM